MTLWVSAHTHQNTKKCTVRCMYVRTNTLSLSLLCLPSHSIIAMSCSYSRACYYYIRIRPLYVILIKTSAVHQRTLGTYFKQVMGLRRCRVCAIWFLLWFFKVAVVNFISRPPHFRSAKSLDFRFKTILRQLPQKVLVKWEGFIHFIHGASRVLVSRI